MGYYVHSHLVYGLALSEDFFEGVHPEEIELPEGLSVYPYGDGSSGDNLGNILVIDESVVQVNDSDKSITGLFPTTTPPSDWLVSIMSACKEKKYQLSENDIKWYVITWGS